MLRSLYHYLFQPTVSHITAKFDAMVADLEAIEKKAKSALTFHTLMASVHSVEADKAARVKANIRSLVS